MPLSEVSKLTHVVERRTHIKRKGKTLFFNVPNYPMALIRQDANALPKEVIISQRRATIVNHIATSNAEKAARKMQSEAEKATRKTIRCRRIHEKRAI